VFQGGEGLADWNAAYAKGFGNRGFRKGELVWNFPMEDAASDFSEHLSGDGQA
jgi:hypothetical protein